MKLNLFLIVIVLSIACTPGVYQPTPQEIATADYGAQPIQAAIPGLVQEYFKSSHYYDPKGVIVDKCSDLYQGWKHSEDQSENSSNKFIFGWKTDCDINAQDSTGAYIGAIWETYFIKDGRVIDGYVPQAYKPIFE